MWFAIKRNKNFTSFSKRQKLQEMYLMHLKYDDACGNSHFSEYILPSLGYQFAL